ncbi:hypothetical protein H4W27_002376 [Nesterenkonia lutea]|uniref:Uncharacterized protein n=1 Tax=Nesterenkonia lutea TaxID=272919 RepID=A0ABR9JH46_9MICC|nr:hypothetical protein [Nesterenkonia lutea]
MNKIIAPFHPGAGSLALEQVPGSAEAPGSLLMTELAPVN